MNVDAVKSMVTEDARYTVFDIAKSKGISSGTVHKRYQRIKCTEDFSAMGASFTDG